MYREVGVTPIHVDHCPLHVHNQGWDGTLLTPYVAASNAKLLCIASMHAGNAGMCLFS